MKKTLLLLASLLMIFQIDAQEEITVEAIWTKGAFHAKSVPGFRFMQDGLHYTKRIGRTIVKYNFLTGEEEDVLFDGSAIEQDGFGGSFRSYAFSKDEKKVLLKADVESVYRRSTRANYFLYDLDSEKLTMIFDEGKIMHATFSPDGNHVAFVFENDLYVKDLGNQKVHRITDDGKWNHVINGSCDWVYEEEFGFTKAFEWSPDSRHIGFLRFDESMVEEFTMTNYHGALYPEYETFKYPKVGEENSRVSVHIFDVHKKSTVMVDRDSGEDGYVPRIKWSGDAADLVVFIMNRHQNKLDLWLANARNGKTRLLYAETNKYYIDIHDDMTFLSSGEGFIWTSEQDGWNQIYLVGNDGKVIRKITDGPYDVTAVYGVDETSGRVYYQSAERSPVERQVYSIGLDGKGKVCLTDKPGWNSGQFNNTYSYFVWNRSDANTPPSYYIFDTRGNLVRTLEENTEIREKMKTFGVQEVEFFTFATTEGVELNGYMIKPQDFDPDKEYPVFMHLYGGPGSQRATDSWGGNNYWWYQMMADKGYLVACVDNRGTGGRGEEFRKMTYLKLGHYETIDQIEAAQYLGSLPWTDANRIGIFGWSYGGYMSSLCLLKGNDVFKAAIAVAPVTNWKWYDTIYTERYMRTLAENPEGYRENSPVHFANRLKGHYLLVHGISDDNVHFQHTAEMTEALIRANKQFETYLYPNRNHGISGHNARTHLYTKMTNFLIEKL